ncbi:MAG TPA: aminotransferase class III-fold pyridoxal phosphate-dependent enzyme [Bdellovibrionota bacterium]|nr:aminotransferase class III-fold pyridoxal phosphate-dependent enzyme [Bdellovibrionota bacterium]
MPAPNKTLILKAAASEILFPLRAYLSVEVSTESIDVRILKAGLVYRGEALSPLRLKAKVASLRSLATWVKDVLHDNLANAGLHAKPNWLSAETYTSADFDLDRAALQELYRDGFVSAEKKELIADLETSQGHYIRSALNPALRIFDAASQIASFNLGFNSSKRQALLMRPEAQSHDALDGSDLEIALGNLLRRKSGLEHAYFLHSGSEANDFCLSQFKAMYPRRAKAFAFEGSFHGRTLLALHTTHSPAKREPFEIYKGLVDFFAFPETKTPDQPAPEPSNWLAHWADSRESHHNPAFLGWLKLGDKVLSMECAVLEKLRKEFQAGNLPFALILEPMQCEGGDRYATARFMRALRVLTRAFDVPMVFDEVQTGFGLGGPFFWHSLFNLQTAKGESDHPDAVTVAKKAQVGACLSPYRWPRPGSPSPAGLHRGYLQAQAAIEGPEVDDLGPLALKALEALREDTIPEWIAHPRGQAFAFAFDLPSAEIAADLIKVRFDHGILIYPAGDRTLRFRLMVSTRRRDLYELYTALYGCIETVARARKLKLKASRECFETNLKSVLNLEDFDLAHKYSETVSKDQATLPTRVEELAALDSGKWQKVFKTLMRLYPEFVHQTQLDLAALKKTSAEDLVARYRDPSEEFSWLNLLWELSRKHSFDIVCWNDRDIESHRRQIDELQAATYEPVRRASVDKLREQAQDSRTLSLACVGSDDSLAGMCIAVPLEMAEDLPFFTSDPARVDRQDLYSTDLTVDSSHRSNGLGLRLKVEQLIAARLHGYRRITSRNRYPEAKAMSRLNQKMGAVVCHVSHTDYGGSGTGWYQSVELRHASHPLEIFQNHATLLNKMCLSNFVSPAYLSFLEIWRQALPPSLRQVYLSSGESEALDKWVKTLYLARPSAHYALSFYGDNFGQGTAAARSLGGPKSAAASPFEWPRLEPAAGARALREYLDQHPSEEVLGVFVEPASKAWLAELAAVGRERNVPIVLNETRSLFGAYRREQTFASESLDVDGFYAYGGNQIAINAVHQKLFVAKPLTMISTWDGDEWSLQIFTERLLRYLESEANL